MCILRFLIGTTLAAPLLTNLSCAAEMIDAPIELRSGVIVDRQGGRMFLMHPDNAIEAVDVGSGRTIWLSKAAAKPLALKGNVLLGQAEQREGGNLLNWVLLDVEAGGKAIRTGTAPLPRNVVSRIDSNLHERFSSRAASINDDFYISWEHETRPISGVRRADDEIAVSQKAHSEQQSSGTLRLNPSTGAVTSVARPDVPSGMLNAQPQAITSPPGSPPDPRRRVSSDGRHTLLSSLIGDDSVWDKYRWTIVDNQTRKQIGEIRSFTSQSPFVVVGSILVYETSPYVRRMDREMKDEPLKIRSADLGSGRELWSRPIRDTTYRGPIPP